MQQITDSLLARYRKRNGGKIDDPTLASMANVVTNRNRNLPWVDRALNPGSYPVTNQDQFMDGNKPMTHRLSYSTGENGEAFVQPEINYKAGQLSWDNKQEPIRFKSKSFADYYSQNGLIKHKNGGKLKYGGDDWTGTDTDLSPEDQALTGIDAIDYNPTGKRTMVDYKNSFDGSEGFGDALSVDGTEGSGLSSAQGSNLMSGIVTVGSGAVMAANKKNNNPNSNYTNAGYYKTQGAAKGATTGASLGASFGPIGIAAGAVIGGAAGYFTGKKKDKQAAQEFARDNSEFEKMRRLEMEGRQPDEPRNTVQYYKNGGPLYKTAGTKPKVNYSGLATTEYNEPNMPLIDPLPIVNIAAQTVLDQRPMGKGFNIANTINDWRKRPSTANSINLGLEGVKLGVGPTGDAIVNTIQEAIFNYTDPKTIAEANQFGMPGNASRGPEPKKKPFKSTPTKVPISSTTAVKKPLKQLAAGGSLLDNFKRTSASTVEVEGPSHENGGVPVPGMPAEVEGGETLAGDYVFSKALGFADLHKPIARMKGKVERKPATRERLNTLKLLNEKENNLKLQQEYTKYKLNLK